MKWIFGLSIVVFTWTSCLASAGGAASDHELTAAEQKTVPALAEKALKARELWKGKIYLTSVEVVRDQSTKPAERCALLTYYRYEGDLGIIVVVRLGKMVVTDVQVHPHMPTCLTAEELAEAEKIARAHPDIKMALAKYKHLDKIEVDAVIVRISQADGPGFKHRVVRLFFRDEKHNYLQYVPSVDVDLTSGEVRIDMSFKMHSK